MQILLASNNKGKVERYRKLLKEIDSAIKLHTPEELHIDALDVEENGATLAENAEQKARAYLGKIDIPILANDTGFYVEGEGFIEAPKRVALLGSDEKSLSQEEITERLLNFWKGIARKHGGKVDAAWHDVFVAIYPDGSVRKAEGKREVVLTDEEFGEAHPQLPIRALYYAKATEKPSVLQTPEEELIELEPVIEALRKVLQK